MAPLLVPLHTFSCLIINFVYLIAWIDNGYFTLRFTKHVGFNLKCVIAVLLPFALLLYIPLSVVAALIFSLVFSLGFPVVETLNAKIQTGWRYAYCTAGWQSTLYRSVRNVQAYVGFCDVYVSETLKKYRNQRYIGPVADIHPWNFVLAIFVGLFSALGMALVLALLLAVKSPFILQRAYRNHFAARSLWFRGQCLVMLAWVLYIFLVPLAVVLAIPAAGAYGVYIGAGAGREVMLARGALLPAGMKLKAGLSKVNTDTTRYILNQNVPFLVLPSSTPVSIGWIAAGFLPLIVGLPVVTIVMLAVVLLSFVAVVSAAYVKVMDVLKYTSKGAKPHIVVLLVLALIAMPIIVLLALMARFLSGVFGYFNVIMITHSKRSLREGFLFIGASIYMLEYGINKFSYARHENDKVHWASLFRFLMPYARPYMPPKEFDEQVDTTAVSIVGKVPRYIPRGMRRPKVDANGRLIDMTGVQGYVVEGTGILVLGSDGQTKMVIPQVEGDTPLPPGIDVAHFMLPADITSAASLPASPASASAPGMQSDAAQTRGSAAAAQVNASAAATAAVPRRRMCMCCAADLDDDDSPAYDPRVDTAASATAPRVGQESMPYDPRAAVEAGQAGSARPVPADDDDDGDEPTHVTDANNTTISVQVEGETGHETASGMDSDVAHAPRPAPAGGRLPEPPPSRGSRSQATSPSAPASRTNSALASPTIAVDTGAAGSTLRERRGLGAELMVHVSGAEGTPVASPNTGGRISEELSPISQAASTVSGRPAPPTSQAAPAPRQPEPEAAARVMSPPRSAAASPPESPILVVETSAAKPASEPVQKIADLPSPLTSPVHMKANAALAKAQAALQQANLATAATRSVRSMRNMAAPDNARVAPAPSAASVSGTDAMPSARSGDSDSDDESVGYSLDMTPRDAGAGAMPRPPSASSIGAPQAAQPPQPPAARARVPASTLAATAIREEEEGEDDDTEVSSTADSVRPPPPNARGGLPHTLGSPGRLISSAATAAHTTSHATTDEIRLDDSEDDN